jgi:hypothetical protein
MKRIVITSLLCGLAFAASAQPPQRTPEPHDLRAADARNEDVKPFCLQSTGSQITKLRNERVADADKRCAPAPGRVFSRREIERIGAMDMEHALRELSPIIH